MNLVYIICALFGHRYFLKGRYNRWTNAAIEYHHCSRCGVYYTVHINTRWYEAGSIINDSRN